jgi:sulfhydrogenase subunit delta
MAKQNNKTNKPRVGFFDLTGCNGCVLSFVFNEDELLALCQRMNISQFRLVTSKKEDTKLDVAFVEGLVATKKDLEILKDIRNRSKTLVAFGTCACTGCIPACIHFSDKDNCALLAYEKNSDATDLPATPLKEHVAVDFFLPGCPPNKKQLASFIKDILLGKTPADYDKPVCFECRLNENKCLLEEKKLCLGPITRGGCDAACINGKMECWGCRSTIPDTNFKLIEELFEEKGFSKENIRERLRTFIGLELEKPRLSIVSPVKVKKEQRKTKIKKKAIKTPKPRAKKVVKTPKKASKTPKKTKSKAVRKKTIIKRKIKVPKRKVKVTKRKVKDRKNNIKKISVKKKVLKKSKEIKRPARQKKNMTIKKSSRQVEKGSVTLLSKIKKAVDKKWLK